MDNKDTRHLNYNDQMIHDEAQFCIAFVFNKRRNGIRFLTGRFAPNRMGGQEVYFPIVGDTLNTVSAIYRMHGIRFYQKNWSRGEMYFGQPVSELGYHDWEMETRTTEELVIVLKALAVKED